jgi:hypothetical protein
LRERGEKNKTTCRRFLPLFVLHFIFTLLREKEKNSILPTVNGFERIQEIATIQEVRNIFGG